MVYEDRIQEAVTSIATLISSLNSLKEKAPYLQENIQRASRLSEALAQSGDQARQILNGWSRQTLTNLGLIPHTK